VRSALADGRHADAARAYFALPPSEAHGSLRPDEAVELASWLRAQGYAEAALTLLRRVVRDEPAAPGIAEVYAAAGLMLLRDLGEPTAAYQYLLTAYELGPRPATQAAVRSALAEIDERQKLRIGRPRNPHPW
jgi:tetratricopeptide (TPR) repeat protein